MRKPSKIEVTYMDTPESFALRKYNHENSVPVKVRGEWYVISKEGVLLCANNKLTLPEYNFEYVSGLARAWRDLDWMTAQRYCDLLYVLDHWYLAYNFLQQFQQEKKPNG